MKFLGKIINNDGIIGSFSSNKEMYNLYITIQYMERHLADRISKPDSFQNCKYVNIAKKGWHTSSAYLIVCARIHLKIF